MCNTRLFIRFYKKEIKVFNEKRTCISLTYVERVSYDEFVIYFFKYEIILFVVTKKVFMVQNYIKLLNILFMI